VKNFLKIASNLAKIWTRVLWHVFLTHGVDESCYKISCVLVNCHCIVRLIRWWISPVSRCPVNCRCIVRLIRWWISPVSRCPLNCRCIVRLIRWWISPVSRCPLNCRCIVRLIRWWISPVSGCPVRTVRSFVQRWWRRRKVPLCN